MSSDQLKIILDNYNGHYMSGSIIKGRAECDWPHSTSQFPALELYISLIRKEHVRIHSSTYSQDTVVGVFHTSIMCGSSRELRVIAFRYYIPKYIASSFQTNFGTVSYVLKAEIQGEHVPKLAQEVPLKIISLYHESSFPREYLNPDHFLKERFVSCCPLRSISMKVITPKRIFTPGEVLPFAVIVSSDSRMSFYTRLCVKLVRVVTYHATPKLRNRRKIQGTILEINEPLRTIEESKYKYKVSLNIPEDIEIINFNNCKLFNVKYKVIIKSKVDGKTLFLKLQMYLGSNSTQPAASVDDDEDNEDNTATVISANDPTTSTTRPSTVSVPSMITYNFPYSRPSAPPVDERDGEDEENDDDDEEISKNRSTARYPESPPPSYDDVMRTVPFKTQSP